MDITYTKALVASTLQILPVGSLLQVDYVPEDGVRPEVARGARLLGTEPTKYIVELTSVDRNKHGEPYFRGKVLNRGEEYRTFNPFKGQLLGIEVLRLGQGKVA